MISICRTIGDSAGSVEIYKTALCDFGDRPARVSRTATLDGSAKVSHYGVSAGDRTFFLDCPVSAAQETTINYLHGLGELVILGCPEGLFLGGLSNVKAINGKFTGTFLVEEKLA